LDEINSEGLWTVKKKKRALKGIYYSLGSVPLKFSVVKDQVGRLGVHRVGIGLFPSKV
jgi:hypothetical protein